jgi:hypothetical protein
LAAHRKGAAFHQHEGTHERIRQHTGRVFEVAIPRSYTFFLRGVILIWIF